MTRDEPAPDDRGRIDRLPDFLIIGAQKSGTSSLQLALSSHPEAYCAGEIHFFCERVSNGLDWYARQLAGGGDKRLLGEKCPHYMSHPQAPARIAQALPGVQLLVVLRDPVQRAHSHYWHMRWRRTERLDFRDALAAEEDRTANGRDQFGYVERGRYLPQLERVCEHHSRDRLHVLLFEDLVRTPAPVLAEVCDFLGIAPIAEALKLPNVNKSGYLRPRWLWRLMNRRRLWRFLPKPAARLLGEAMKRERPYIPLDSDVERELRLRFEADNQALAAWLGRDLVPWGVRRR